MYYKEFRWRLIAVIVVGSISIIAFAFMPIFMRDSFDALRAWLDPTDGSSTIGSILFYLGIFGALALFNAGFDMFCTFMILKFQNKVMIEKIAEVKRKLDVVPASFLDGFTAGDLARRVNSMTGEMLNNFIVTIYTIARVIVFFTTTAIMMFYINWILAIVVIMSLPLCVIMARVISKRTQKYFNNFAKSVTDVSTHIDQKFSLQEFYTLHGIEDDGEKFKKMNKEHTKAMVGETTATSLNTVYITFVQNFMMLAVTFVFAIMFVRGSITEFGVLPAFVMFSNRFLANAVVVTTATNLLQAIAARAPRVFEILYHQGDITEKEHIDIKRVHNSITLKNVSLVDKHNHKLLDNVSCEIKQGSSVAFVGGAGSGKTFLVELLAKLALPTKGKIYVDGVSLDEITSKSYYKCVGISLERPFIFRGTVAENLLYGIRRELPENVMAVTEKLGSHRFINDLENGYETQLSGDSALIGNGEKQAICVARLVLQNTDVAVFHQSLSSADAVTEKHVYEKIMRHKKSQTTIFVTHRLASVEKCDIIYYMEHGKIVERGTHRELMAKRKKYYHAYIGG